MKRTVVLILSFSLLAVTAFAAPPRSVDEIPVYQGALRDLAAEGDFLAFASGVARVYRTTAPIEEVFAFYKDKLNAKSGIVAELVGSSSHPTESTESVTYSVENYEESGATPELQKKSVREVLFFWATTFKDGSAAEFGVELLNGHELEDNPSQPRDGTRIGFTQFGVMHQVPAPPLVDDEKQWLASLPPPAIPELDRWRDVTGISGLWAFGGSIGGAGPLVKGKENTGGSGFAALKRLPIDRYFPNQLTFTGPLTGTGLVSNQISFNEGSVTESGGCGGSVVGQDEGLSYLSVTLDLDDGTYRVDLTGTIRGCSKVQMQVTDQDVSFDADEASFSVMPNAMAPPPTIPREGFFLALSSPAMIVAGHGLPLVGEGSMNLQLGNVPDGWLEKLKKKAEEEEKKNAKPPKEVYKPDTIWIKSLHAWLHEGPDYLSDVKGELRRNQEVELLEKRGRWLGVRDPKSGKEGWINQTDTIERKIDWSRMDQLGGRGKNVSSVEVELGGRG